MKKEQYIQIKEFLRGLIRGTMWEGHVFAVGGCVRDELMGCEIKDIDLCVSLPSGGVRFAQWLRDKRYTAKGVAVYPSYGTAMLHLKAFPEVELEFVQTRKEKYIDHSCRNPETAFGTIEEDCMRRDLTINALYTNISTGEIVDITGRGVNDIRDHIIRTPAEPDLTYDDDPLRILRCIRFASRFGWEIEADTFKGMVRNADRLAIITKERVKDELDKMLTCRQPVMAMELLRKTGAMHYVIPELEDTYEMVQDRHSSCTVWEHTLAVLEQVKSDRTELRMAALLHELTGAEMVDRLLRPLHYSNEFIREVQFLVGHHTVCQAWGHECEHMEAQDLRKLQYLCHTEERFRNLLLLIDADNNAQALGRRMPRQVELILQCTEKMKAEGSAMFGYRLPLTGKDVMDIKGIKPGPEVKECLDYLLNQAFINPLCDKDEVTRQLKDYQLSQSPA